MSLSALSICDEEKLTSSGLVRFCKMKYPFILVLMDLEISEARVDFFFKLMNGFILCLALPMVLIEFV